MRKCRRPIIAEMKFPKDFVEICNWEKEYKDDKDFEPLKKYIEFEAQEYKAEKEFDGQKDVNVDNYSLVDLFQHKHFDEIKQNISHDERNLAYVLKNEEGKIVAWILADFCDLSSHVNPLYITGFAVHPKYQNKGIAKKFLNELFSNPEHFFGSKPDQYYIFMSKDNKPGVALLERFGFNLVNYENSVNAFAHSPTLRNESEPSSSN